MNTYTVRWRYRTTFGSNRVHTDEVRAPNAHGAFQLVRNRARDITTAPIRMVSIAKHPPNYPPQVPQVPQAPQAQGG